jgi:hypothetical protein
VSGLADEFTAASISSGDVPGAIVGTVVSVGAQGLKTLFDNLPKIHLF